MIRATTAVRRGVDAAGAATSPKPLVIGVTRDMFGRDTVVDSEMFLFQLQRKGHRSGQMSLKTGQTKLVPVRSVGDQNLKTKLAWTDIRFSRESPASHTFS